MHKKDNFTSQKEKTDLLTVHDFAQLGVTIEIENNKYTLDEILLIVNKNQAFFTMKYTFEKNKIFLCAFDVIQKKLISLSKSQLEKYINCRTYHEERLGNVQKLNIENVNHIHDATNGIIDLNENTKCLLGKENYILCEDIALTLNEKSSFIDTFHALVSINGDSSVVVLPNDVFISNFSKEGLYNFVDINWKISGKGYLYRGNVVRIRKSDDYIRCYIQPYSMEILQSKTMNGIAFEKVNNMFSIMDFMINISDSDVKGIVYPDSENRSIQNYIVVGVLENIKVSVEDCILGNVRIGVDIEIPEIFEKLLTPYRDKQHTLIWVNVVADSLYNALSKGKVLLQSAADFLAIMIKNDTYTDWYGTMHNEKGYWDIRNHSPKIILGKIFYVENCIMGESVSYNEESFIQPQSIEIHNDSEYLFENEWIEKLFLSLEEEKPKIMRLQHAIKWIMQAWNTEDKYDQVIYCSMALEFIVNGEKGQNIFEEHIEDTKKKTITKKEKNKLVAKIVEGAKLDEVEGLEQDEIDRLNESIQNMIKNKLGDASFFTKLKNLISRLNIPINDEEMELLDSARRIRNQLIHGIEMKSMSTLDGKKLRGVTSRILMYKLQDELQEK